MRSLLAVRVPRSTVLLVYAHIYGDCGAQFASIDKDSTCFTRFYWHGDCCICPNGILRLGEHADVQAESRRKYCDIIERSALVREPQIVYQPPRHEI